MTWNRELASSNPTLKPNLRTETLVPFAYLLRRLYLSYRHRCSRLWYLTSAAKQRLLDHHQQVLRVEILSGKEVGLKMDKGVRNRVYGLELSKLKFEVVFVVKKGLRRVKEEGVVM